MKSKIKKSLRKKLDKAIKRLKQLILEKEEELKDLEFSLSTLENIDK